MIFRTQPFMHILMCLPVVIDTKYPINSIEAKRIRGIVFAKHLDRVYIYVYKLIFSIQDMYIFTKFKSFYKTIQLQICARYRIGDSQLAVSLV